MKAGVCSYCFNPMFIAGEITLPEAIAFIGKETDADCFEPLTRFLDPDRDENEQAREFKDQMDDLGLEASCYTLDSDFSVFDEAAYRTCIERSIARLDTALLLGTHTIRLDPRSSLSGRSPEEVDADDILARVAKGMQEITDAAAEKGMAVGMENHGRLLGRTAQVARFLERVDRPNFGVNLDPTNFRSVFGEDHIEATRRFADRVVHVHIKDFHISQEPREGEEWRQIPSGEYVKRAVGGEGNTGWAEMFGILKEAGYDGAISLEVTDPADIKGSVTRGVDNIKRVIAEVEGQ